MSVPEVVREIITRNRSIYDCMKMDLINYTALAVKIQPEIEKFWKFSVNLKHHSCCNQEICRFI